MKDQITRRVLNWLEPLSRWVVPIFSWLLKAAAFPQTQKLNWRIYESVKSIPPQELVDLRERLERFGEKRALTPDVIHAWLGHAQRLFLSEEWINRHVSQLPMQANALDLGPPSLATDYWKEEFPNFLWKNTDWDLRSAWPLPPNSVELICCTELIEHLSDPPNDIYNEGFYQSGFQNMLKQSYRVLSPGGIFFGTTPNGASIYHLEAVLKGQPPWFFTKHVREYTLVEVSNRIAETGFELIAIEDVHCLTVNNWKDYKPIFTLLLSQGFPTSTRGDDLFIVARKPFE